MELDRKSRSATLTVKGPGSDLPSDAAAIRAAGDQWWPLRAFRELDDALCHLRANEDLIGAPTGLASLRFASVVLLDEGYVVTWLQDAGRPDAGREPAPGSIPEGPAVSFWFTRHGDLVTVENTTRLSLPAVLDRR